MAFYNHGDIRMEVTEEELLKSWKDFFSTGTNWKDLEIGITYEEYCKISEQKHLKKILDMPVHYLMESGRGFFVEKDEGVLGLRDELENVIEDEVMKEQMGDVIRYRAMDYYRRRYREKEI